MEKIVVQFAMSDSKPVAEPMKEFKSRNNCLKLITDGNENPAGVPYREAIESLMYLMLRTGPNIAIPVKKLGNFRKTPIVKHWIAEKRVLQYLTATTKLG